MAVELLYQPLDKEIFVQFLALIRSCRRRISFHNANSAISRRIWDIYPFDEDATNIEDRIWGKKVIEDGYNIYYEPSASVYHHHGINHTLDERRADKIVNIMQQLDYFSSPTHAIDPLTLHNYCLIPILGPPIILEGQCLLPVLLNVPKKVNL